MKSTRLAAIARRLMRRPAAPYHEAAVRAEAERVCAEHGLTARRDDFGNLIVRHELGRGMRPLVLAAHLDHPGFEVVRPLAPGRWLARFLGGVPDEYFRRGTPLRLMPRGVPATLGRRLGPVKHFELHAVAPRTRAVRAAATDAAAPTFAVWELEDFVLRQGRIHGRACDDLIGVAAILATLIELKEQRARTRVIGVISRAEEVGFQGALAVAATKALPRDALVISLETSRELPPARMGQGVILRVGDRTSIFDSEATRFLSEVAAGVVERDKTFRHQRALMSGGTCEATAYQEFGWQTAAVCVALGNYHNCGPRRRIAAEYVSLADACGMVQLLVAAAHEMRNYERLVDRLPARLQKLLQEAHRKLR